MDILGQLFNKTTANVMMGLYLLSKPHIVKIDCKELFVQPFVKIFDQDGSTWKRKIKE